jgi:hypothetical protein
MKLAPAKEEGILSRLRLSSFTGGNGGMTARSSPQMKCLSIKTDKSGNELQNRLKKLELGIKM